jgi:colicin import membrane protein
MSVNELEALRESVTKCWNLVGLVPPDTGDLRVKIKVFLNQDGSVAQQPQILEAGSSTFAQASAAGAVRAVQRCAPYSFLPPEKYDSWREVNMTFDPRQMFAGG